jgi:hypothetical protein
MWQDERDPAGNTIRLCLASSPPCAKLKYASLVAGSERTGLRCKRGMDDGDPSTVNEEKERCSLP